MKSEPLVAEEARKKSKMWLIGGVLAVLLGGCCIAVPSFIGKCRAAHG